MADDKPTIENRLTALEAEVKTGFSDVLKSIKQLSGDIRDGLTKMDNFAADLETETQERTFADHQLEERVTKLEKSVK